MKTVKLSLLGSSSDLNLSQFTGNTENVFGGYRFVVNSPVRDADFWFVVEGTNQSDEECCVPSGSLVYLSAETSLPIDWFRRSRSRMKYLSQFDWVYSHYEVPLDGAKFAFPFLPWMINANHGEGIMMGHSRNLNVLRELQGETKAKKLSMICSNREWTVGHRIRLRFARGLKAHFGERLDWFGNGIQAIPEKWDGLAPYEYTIVLENQMQNGVLTEKLIDAYLASSFPLYWGAPDADSVFPRDSFVRVNPLDLEGTIRNIEMAIEVPYHERLTALQSARQIALTDFHFLHRITAICDDIQASGRWNPENTGIVRLQRPSRVARLDWDWTRPRDSTAGVLLKLATRLGGTLH